MFGSKFRSLWKDRYGTASLIHRLLSEQGARHSRGYAFSFLLMAVASGCTALVAYLIGQVVNETYVYRNFAALGTLCLITVAAFAVRGLAYYGQAVILTQINNQIVAEEQARLFDKLLREKLGYFADRHSTEFMNQIVHGATAISGTLQLLVTAVGRDGLLVIGLVIVMVIQDPVLSLIGLVILPLAAIGTRQLARQMRSLALDQYHGGASIMQTLQETLQGMRIVKAFRLEDEMRRRFSQYIDSMQRIGNAMARVSNRSRPLMETLGGVAIALVFLYGGYRVIETGAQPGFFFAFITAFLLAYEPAKRLARVHVMLASGLRGARVLYEFLDAPPSEPDDGAKPSLDIREGKVAFDQVQFGYRAGEPVIRRMSFVAQPRRVTALVGPSGGGKSTILSLIPRFYDLESGTILIDDQDVVAVSLRSLRGQIAYVGQDAQLFRGSIRDNIVFGKLGATEEEVISAAKAAYAHDFIMSFPGGYDTPVGELGTQLSGGQRQRVAIARALIKDAPVILLDEATAALDSESELQVRNAIGRLCKGRTTIVVAHRLHTIEHADQILVVEEGAVVESGRHSDLLQKGGRYAAFYKLQLRHQTAEHGTQFEPLRVEVHSG